MKCSSFDTESAMALPFLFTLRTNMVFELKGILHILRKISKLSYGHEKYFIKISAVLENHVRTDIPQGRSEFRVLLHMLPATRESTKWREKRR